MLIDFECPPCQGTGTLQDEKARKVMVCHKCGGQKIIQIDSERLTHHCWQCDGTGLRDGGPALCPICRGDGYDRPGVPTGPGHAHVVLPSIGSSPETVLEADVTIEAATAELTLTSYPATVEVEEATKKRFTEAPQAVIADAENALAITLALQDILHQERSNSNEANEAKSLLRLQHTVLNDLLAALRSHQDTDAARNDAIQLLHTLVASILRNWASDGPVRGTLAAAAISMASVLGVDLHWTSQLLIAGSFVGKEVIDALRSWAETDRASKDE